MSPEKQTIILLPAYNEAATIGAVVRDVVSFGTVLVVDDGSRDGTGDLAEAAGARVLRLDTNRGYERALDAGFAEADRLGAEVVVTFDADGQFEASLLDRILEPLRTGRADLVLGRRPKMARFSEGLFGLYTGLRFGIRDILCGVKAYRIDLYRAHGRFDAGRSVGTELALASVRRGTRFEVVEAPVGARAEGGSRFGQRWRANARILTALRLAVAADLARVGSQR